MYPSTKPSAASPWVQLTNDEATNAVICTPVYPNAANGFKFSLGDGSAKSKVAGVVIDPTIRPGATGNVLNTGIVTATTAQWDAVCGTSGGLTYGTLYYLSTTVAGTLTTSSASGVAVIFGLGPTVGAIVLATSSGGGSGTITGVTAGSGLTGGGTSGGVIVALANTAVTPGVYTNLNATVTADGRLTAASNGSGSGGGITNSAGNHVVMVSDGTNAIASSISDDGTKVTLSKQVGLGSAVPFAYRLMQITNADPTLEECLWIEDNATGHVGSAGQNQAIALVLREQGTTNTTAGAATATCMDAAVTQTKSAGSNTLTNTCILANASGGDVNYSFFSSNGLMVQTGDASFGNFAASGTLSATGAGSVGGTFGVGGILTASSTCTLGPSGGTGKIHTINGNIALRSPDADTYLNIKNNSTGGRDYFLEASGNGGTDPNCFAIFDNTAGATRFKVTSTGDCVANLRLGFGAARISSGAVTPNTNVTGNVGDLYTWTSGAAGTVLWVKESGAGTTSGWVSK